MKRGGEEVRMTPDTGSGQVVGIGFGTLSARAVVPSEVIGTGTDFTACTINADTTPRRFYQELRRNQAYRKFAGAL
jgi:hypothetical protein